MDHMGQSQYNSILKSRKVGRASALTEEMMYWAPRGSSRRRSQENLRYYYCGVFACGYLIMFVRVKKKKEAGRGRMCYNQPCSLLADDSPRFISSDP